MAATYSILYYNGSGPSSTTWTNGARFHRADTSPTTDGATTFIPIPAAGTNYSWRKHFKLNVTGGTYTTISNLRFFSDGTSWGTGVTAYAATASSYTQASASDNSSLIAGGTDVTTYTSGSPLTVNAGTVSSSNATGTGTQDYVVMQVGVGTTASAGTTTARTLTYRVDEV